MLYKEIHLGELIKERVAEQEISIERICNFLGKEEDIVEEFYTNKSMDTELLLRLCKFTSKFIQIGQMKSMVIFNQKITRSNKFPPNNVAINSFQNSFISHIFSKVYKF